MKPLLLHLVSSTAILAGLRVEATSPGPSQEMWKGATSYPTTITRSWTRTLTAKPTSGVVAPVSEAAVVTIQTVTMYEAWPSSPDPARYPYTLLQTAITARQVYSAQRNGAGKLAPTGDALSLTMDPAATAPRTVTSTWLMWDTSPTDLAAGQALPPCATPGGASKTKTKNNNKNSPACATPNLKQDTRCIERGLTTACHSQCQTRRIEGWDVWMCHKVGDGTSRSKETGGSSPSMDLREVGVGRVCTDSNGYYEQLLEPCDVMDHGHGCPPCSM